MIEKSRNGDTLGPVELIVWPEQGNQGDWREQDGHGEVSIIIFGMSKSSGSEVKFVHPVSPGGSVKILPVV